MKTKDNIILYLDGQMSQEEKSRFEEELKNSPTLRNELDDCRKLLNEFQDVKAIPLDENYFINLLYKFREKISYSGKFKFFPALGFDLAAILLIIIFSFLILPDRPKIVLTEDVVNSLDENEAEYILNNYSYTETSLDVIANNIENYDSVLTNLLADKLVSGNIDYNYLMESTGSNYYNLTGQITESQAEIIYNELINKKFY